MIKDYRVTSGPANETHMIMLTPYEPNNYFGLSFVEKVQKVYNVLETLLGKSAVWVHNHFRAIH
jgi:hypothetical protein